MLYSKNVAMVVTGAALALSLGLVGCGGQTPQTTTEPATTEQTSTTTTETTTTEQTTDQTTAPKTQETTTQTTTENAQPATEAPKTTADSYIGDAEAKRIALEHAGVAESDCYELKSELDTDDAVIHYDVDFKSGGMEYDYDIDAVTGAIISSHAEVDD